MLHLMICDSNSEHLLLLDGLISSIQKKAPLIGLTSSFFRHPQNLLDQLFVTRGENLVYILEIVFNKQVNGLQLAQIIREKQPFANILFFTDQKHYANKIIDLHISPLAYLSKSLTRMALEEELERILFLCDRRQKVLRIADPPHISSETHFIHTVHNRKNYIPYRDILYFEHVGNHKIYCQTLWGTYTFYSTLKTVHQKAINFLQLHQSFLLNPSHPWRYDFRQKALSLTLPSQKNKVKIPIGRTFLSRHKTWLSSLDENQP